MKKLIMTMAAVVLMSASATAQNEKECKCKCHEKKIDKTEMVKHRTDEMVKRYELNDQQAKQLLELNTKYADKMHPRGPHHGPKGGPRPPKADKDGKAQRPEPPKDGKDGKAQRPEPPKDGKHGDHKAHHQQMAETMKAYDAELQKIMTPEQFKAYQADMQKRHEHHGHKKHDGHKKHHEHNK